MKDNASLIFLSIIGVLLLVILPLVSVLDRQDNMSYNLAMKLTTSFTDEVRTKGYIDTASYDKLVQGLAATGNSYDIKMEAHRRILVKSNDWTESNPSYVEDTLIDYNTDIFESMESGDKIYNETINAGSVINNKSDVYLLEKGDEFYVKVKNTNVTAASIIYNYLSRTAQGTIININYGGVVNNNSWEKYPETDDNLKKEPEVLIGLPKNMDNITPIRTFDMSALADPNITPFYYYFNLMSDSDKKIKFTLDIRYANRISAEIAADKNKILNYIELDGFGAGTKTVDKISEYKYEITLENMHIEAFNANASVCKIIVKEDIAQGEYGSSTKTEGTEFTIFDEMNMHSVTIKGPYQGATNTLIAETAGRIRIVSGTAISFIVEYTGITETPTAGDILSRLQYIEFTNNNAVTITNITYDQAAKTGSARINLTPTLQSSLFQRLDNYLFLEEGSAHTARDEQGTPSAYSTQSNKFDIINETIWNFDFRNYVQTETIEYTGTYRLEVWGARGGNDTYADKCGKGGYSKGQVRLTKGTIIYIYTGGTGSNGSFNGGGTGRLDYHKGGGATDIRIGTDSLYSRIIVAGGGGRIWWNI